MKQKPDFYDIQSRQGFADAVMGISGLLFSVSFSVLKNQDLCADAVQSAILKA